MGKSELEKLQLPPLDEIIDSAFEKAEVQAEKETGEKRKVEIDSRFKYSLCVLKQEEDGQGLIQIEDNGYNYGVICRYFRIKNPVNDGNWCQLTGQMCHHSRWRP